MLTNPPFIEVPFMFYSWEMVLVVFEERMQGGGWTMVNNVVLVKFWLNTRSRETKNLDPYFISGNNITYTKMPGYMAIQILWGTAKDIN